MLKKYTNPSQIFAFLLSFLLATIFTVCLQEAWAGEFTLSGKVTDSERKPVSNAKIIIHRKNGGMKVVGDVRTAADGSYRAVLKPGIYVMEIRPPEQTGLPCQWTDNVELNEDKTLDIILKKGVIISGKVTDANGKPLTNAHILVWRGQMKFGCAGGTTSADGVYRIVLPPGTYTLNVEPIKGSGLPRETIKSVQVKEDMTLDIKLKSTILTLSGRLTDSDGKPVNNAEIKIHSKDGGGVVGVWTAADGSYSVTLQSGAYVLAIRPPEGSGLLHQWTDDVKLTGDKTLNITLKKGVILSGKVKDTHGNSVASWVFTHARGSEPIQSWKSKTSADGVYRIVLPAGIYTLSVEPLTGGELFGETIRDVQVKEDMTLDITLKSIILSGRVTDVNGKPVADVEINVSGQRHGRAKTSKDGSYSITLAPGERYWMEVRPPLESGLLRKTLKDVKLEEDKTLNITLERGLILSGRITDGKGKLVTGVRIYANPSPDGQFGEGHTTSEGKYHITLATGTYMLNIHPPEGKLPQQTISNVKVSEDTTLDIKLKDGVILSGKVTDTNGKPVANAYVNAHCREPAQWGGNKTKADGTYRIALLPGTYTLNVNPDWKSGLPRNTIKDVQVKEDMTLDITLKTAILSGQVTDAMASRWRMSK